MTQSVFAPSCHTKLLLLLQQISTILSPPLSVRIALSALSLSQVGLCYWSLSARFPWRQPDWLVVMLNMEDYCLSLAGWGRPVGAVSDSVLPGTINQRCQGHAPSGVPTAPYLTSGAGVAVVLLVATLWGGCLRVIRLYV